MADNWWWVESGAKEIDIVISRGDALRGDWNSVYEVCMNGWMDLLVRVV